MSTPNPPAGWYPDPEDPARERRWDGAQWTNETRAKGGAAVPPQSPPAATSVPGMVPAGPKTNGLAVASLILGILALPLLIFAPVGAFFGLLALIFGVVAVRQIGRDGTSGKGMAIGGVVTGLMAVVIGVLLVAFVVNLVNDPDFQQEIQDMVEELEDQQG